MTLVVPERQPAEAPRDGIRELVTPDGLAALDMLLNRAIATIVHGDSPLLRRVITESVRAFIDYDGDPEPAITRVAPLMWEVGDQHARNGYDADDLTESFRRTQAAAQRGLKFVLGSALTRTVMDQLRRNVVAFVRRLHQQAWLGWERTHAILAMSDDERRTRLGSALLEPSDAFAVEKLAEFTHVDLTSSYMAVVSASGELPRTLLDHPDTLTGHSQFEALVPTSWRQKQLADHLESTFAAASPQAVVGPSVQLADIGNTASPTRRGAELLRDGLAIDSRVLVPCTDLLASLVVDGNPKLTELIVAKHLGRMESMTLHRRLTTGELLLQWLERGLPLNKLARDLGIPAQTAHSRMKSIRTLFGDAIDDPAQRLELIIALQATLPRWRAEAHE